MPACLPACLLQREDRGSRKDAAKARRERQEVEKRDAKRQKGYANALGKEQEKNKLAYQVRSLTGAIDLRLTRTCLLDDTLLRVRVPFAFVTNVPRRPCRSGRSFVCLVARTGKTMIKMRMVGGETTGRR